MGNEAMMTIETGKYLLHVGKQIQQEANELWKPAHEVVTPSKEMVLAHSIFRGSRGYIEKVVFQINSTYEVSCFDACSVMIRKLIEILVIECFEHHAVDSQIKNSSGDFLMLADLIDCTLQCSSWNLGREVKSSLPKLKKVGDRSAHNRRYTAHRQDIDTMIDPLRITSQELLAIAGLK